MKDKYEFKRYLVEVDRSIHKPLRILAAEKEVSVKKLVSDAVRKLLKEEGIKV